MNPLYSPFPETVEIDGREYRVKTDFREWIRFADVCSDTEMTAEEKMFFIYELFEGESPRDFIKGLRGLFGFFSAEDLAKTGRQRSERGEKLSKGKPPVFSYYYDSAYILGAFLQVYGIDLIDISYMHWYKFRVLLEALPDRCPLKERIGYRGVNLSDIKDNKERRRIRKIQRALEIPFPVNGLSDTDIGEILGNL